MMKKKTKMAGSEKLIGIIFSIIGLVMVVIGIVIAMTRVNFINNADKVRGTVTDIGYSSNRRGGSSGGMEVTYTYEGEEYVRHISATSSLIQEGDSIEIYVDRENPREIELESFAFFPVYIVGGIGAVFLIFGLIFLLVVGRHGKKKKLLMTEGRKVYAEVTGGSMNFNYSVNGRHPFRLECRYTDPYTGAVYLYSSGNTWLDPNLYIGRQVAVYVDKADISRYYVDVDSLNEAGAGNGNQPNVYDFR